MAERLEPQEVAFLIKGRQILKARGLSADTDITRICEAGGISRKTGYQWARDLNIHDEDKGLKVLLLGDPLDDAPTPRTRSRTPDGVGDHSRTFSSRPFTRITSAMLPCWRRRAPSTSTLVPSTRHGAHHHAHPGGRHWARGRRRDDAGDRCERSEG